MRTKAVACHSLLLLLFVQGQAQEITCGDVYASLQQHVRSRQAWPVLENDQACMSDAFIIRSLMYMNTSTLQESNGVFFLTKDSRALAELLTFSIIGRHFIQQESQQSFAFSWNRCRSRSRCIAKRCRLAVTGRTAVRLSASQARTKRALDEHS